MKTYYTVALSIFVGAVLGAGVIQSLHAQAKPPVYTSEKSRSKTRRLTGRNTLQRLRR